MAGRHVRLFTLAVATVVAVTTAGTAHAAAHHLARRGLTVTGSPTGTSRHLHVLGDFDGDGERDLVVSDPGADRVRVTYTRAKPGGRHVQWLTLPEATLGSAHFGGALALGDFNGDGYTDLAVGAPDWANPSPSNMNRETAGAVYVYDGSKTGLHYSGFTVHGPYDGDEPYDLGGALAAADINHDGYADLAITVGGGDDNDVRVLYGSSSGLSGTGEQDFDDSDVGALAFGDIDHNGYPDLVLGDVVDLGNGAGEIVGDVQVIYGHKTGLSNAGRQKISGDEVGVVDGLGESVAVGDLNRDGYADIVVGDPTGTVDHPNPGKVIIFYGSKHGISVNRRQTIKESSHLGAHAAKNDLFGWSVAIGRINGDKYPDLVIGAPGVKVGGLTSAGAIYVLRGSKSGPTTRGFQRFTQSTKGVPGRARRHGGYGLAVDLSALASHKYDDLIAAAPRSSQGGALAGYVTILRGSRRGVTTKHAIGIQGADNAGQLGTVVT